jgi:Mrp family chromosome partitioning ATPase/uncharacterized protein involved in exopolysaccharide biosynthesis
MSLIKLLKIFWKRKVLLFGTPILAIGLAYLVTAKYFPNLYKSIAQISTGFTTNESVVNEENNDDPDTKFINVIETMKSPLVVNLLSYQLLSHEFSSLDPYREPSKSRMENFKENYASEFNFSYNDIEELKEKLNYKLENFELLNVEDEKLILELLRLYGYDFKSLVEKLQIERIGDSDFISVKFISQNPQLSAFVVNTLSREFIRFYDNKKVNINSNSLDYLTRLVERKKSELDFKNEELSSLKSRSNVIDAGYESGAKIAQIRELELKKESLLESIRGLKLQIEDLDNRIESSQSTTSASQINQRIVDLQNKINDLNKLYMSTGSNNKELESTLERLRVEYRNEMAKISSRKNEIANRDDLIRKQDELKLELRIANNNLASNEASISRLKRNASGIASKETAIAAIEKEVEKAMEEYLSAVNEYNKEKNKTLITESSIKLIIPGQPSNDPENPIQVKAMAGAGAGTFMLMFFLVIFLELIDMRIKTPKMFIRKIKLGLSGAINFIDTSKLDLSRLFKENESNSKYETFKQALRHIRYEIQNNPKARVYLVTSARKGDGKTFLILCLAYSLSLLQKKVLLIDTNFKNNALTETLIPDAGYFKLLENGSKLLTDPNIEHTGDQLPTSIISSTSNENIDIIGSSRVNNSPSEIFSGKNFDDMLKKLLGHYDYIFMEGSSLNDYSDTKELIQYADKVIPVFSAKSPLKQRDKETVNYLQSLNGKLTGAVLNKVDLEEMEAV